MPVLLVCVPGSVIHRDGDDAEAAVGHLVVADVGERNAHLGQPVGLGLLHHQVLAADVDHLAMPAGVGLLDGLAGVVEFDSSDLDRSHLRVSVAYAPSRNATDISAMGSGKRQGNSGWKSRESACSRR